MRAPDARRFYIYRARRSLHLVLSCSRSLVAPAGARLARGRAPAPPVEDVHSRSGRTRRPGAGWRAGGRVGGQVGGRVGGRVGGVCGRQWRDLTFATPAIRIANGRRHVDHACVVSRDPSVGVGTCLTLLPPDDTPALLHRSSVGVGAPVSAVADCSCQRGRATLSLLRRMVEDGRI